MTRSARLLLFTRLFQPVHQAFRASAPSTDHLLDPFAAGWMLSNTNGDGIVD